MRSNLLLYHTRWDRPEDTILSAERRDVLRPDGDGWLLARRLVVLDNTVIPTLNMGFFLSWPPLRRTSTKASGR